MTSQLDSYFEQKTQDYSHPLIKYLDSANLEKTVVEVFRPDVLLGYKPAKLSIQTFENGQSHLPREYQWEDELNDALISRGIPAIDKENEKIRFALALRFGFQRAVTRYGDGYFNSVMGEFVRQSGFEKEPEVADVLEDVRLIKPETQSRSYGDCFDFIDNVIRKRARELVEQLKYPKPTASEILAGAVAKYLDERFTVSYRRRLGLTSPKLT